MAHVQRLQNSKGERVYKVRWRSLEAGATKFHSRSFDRLKDAEAFTHGLRPGQDYSATRKTFADYAEAWIDTVTSRGRKARTVDGYRNGLRYALRFFDGVRVGEITALEAQAFLQWLQAGNEHTKGIKTPRSVHGAWHPFRATMGLALRQSAIPSNPADAVDLPSLINSDQRQARYHFLRPEEVASIAAHLTAAGREPYDLLVLFAAYTGLRRGEVAGLDVRHVTTTRSHSDWGGAVRVEQTRRKAPKNTPPGNPHLDPNNPGWWVDTPKSGKARTVPLPSWLAEDMHTYLQQHPNGTDPTAPLWPGRAHEGGRPSVMDWSSPWDAESFYRYHFKRALRGAGLPVGSAGSPGVRFHDLRHTYASWLAHDGVRPEVVAKLLGHRDATITLQIYTHLWPEDLADAVSGLDRRPTAAPPRPTTTNVLPMRGRAASL